MEKEFERTKRVKFREIDALSKKYLSDNEDEVRTSNQRMIVTVTSIYFLVIIIYNIIVPIFFSDWGVAYIYQIALVVHLAVATFVFLRYRKTPRSLKEVQAVCVALQLYVMTFLGIVSVLPLEMDQPAVYFAPMVMGFIVIFMYTFKTALILCLFESVAIIVISFVFKSMEVCNVNMFCALLTFFVALYVMYVVYSNKINESRHRKKLRKMGQTDKLTGIYNRAATEMMSHEYMHTNSDKSFGLMIIDIDEFKSVNDTYGHQTGDMVIASVAKIIETAAGPDNIAGRMGGDEFMIFMKGWKTQDDMKKIAAEILRNAQKIEMPDDRVSISCSIGVCALKDDEWMEYDELFSCADKALYYIKEHGKNCYAFYAKDATGSN
ncbi:MAG: GGDEF domain-containing protein [Lachnospiraceae bacterium]|nr:GGDEF domain-containing protein [Lachnospiraceae bacterium]